MENSPTPDYGSMGPTPDAPLNGSQSSQSKSPAQTKEELKRSILRVLLPLEIMLVLAVLGLAVAKGQVGNLWEQVESILGLQGKPKAASASVLSEHEIESLDRMTPQSQAELLLERSINHYDGANAQIEERVNGWYGRLQRTRRFDGLFSTAINSDDLRVRAAAIEIDLAVYNAPKNSDSISRYEQQAEPTGGDRITALWLLGLLGNRGVEQQRVFQILMRYIHEADPKIQVWAVEGLGYLGTDEVIDPLLGLLHDDPSPMIRERAACNLAQSGMLSQAQRKLAIPRLLDFADDASLDAQTHSWVFQALRDITGASVASNASAWREWYREHGSQQ